MEGARAWQQILQLPPPDKGDVLDVAWAPNVGRRFHYIASAEGEQLKVYKLLRGDGSSTTSTANEVAITNLTLESSQTIATSAWRCQWNVTGTVLASSGDAAVVQLWKSNGEGQFECVSTVQSPVAPPGTSE
jgi:nucleoporin SEH1